MRAGKDKEQLDLLKGIARKYASDRAEENDFDIADRPLEDIVSMFAEHPVQQRFMLKFLVEVQAILGINTQPIWANKVRNERDLLRAFEMEYEEVLLIIGTPKLQETEDA